MIRAKIRYSSIWKKFIIDGRSFYFVDNDRVYAEDIEANIWQHYLIAITSSDVVDAELAKRVKQAETIICELCGQVIQQQFV